MTTTTLTTVLTATDRTQAAFSSAQAGVRALNSGYNELSGTIGTVFTGGVGRALAAVIGLGAAGLGISALKDRINEVASAAARLDDVAEAFGTTVETASKAATIFKVSGSSVDAYAAALGRLGKGLVGIEDDTKGFGGAIDYLRKVSGQAIDETDDLGLLYEQIAVAMAKVPDSAQKTQIAIALFGKTGAEQIPLLKDYAENIGLVGKTTAEQAASAEFYEKALKRLEIVKGSISKTIANEFIPVIGATVDEYVKLITQNNGLKKSIEELARDGTLRTWAQVTAVAVAILYDTVKTTAEGFQTLVAYFDLAQAKIEKSAARSASEYEAAVARINKANATIDKPLSNFGRQLADRFEAENAARASGKGTLYSDAGYSGERERAPRVGGGSGSAKGKIDDLEKQLQALYDKINAVSSGFTADYEKNIRTLTDAFNKGLLGTGKQAQEKYLQIFEALRREQPFVKALAADALKLAEARDKQIDAEERLVDAAKKVANDLVADNELIGASEKERSDAVLERQRVEALSAAIAAGATESTIRQINASYDLAKAQKTVNDAKRNELETDARRRDFATNALADLTDRLTASREELTLIGQSTDATKEYAYAKEQERIITSSLTEEEKLRALALLQSIKVTEDAIGATKKQVEEQEKLTATARQFADDLYASIADALLGAGDSLDNFFKKIAKQFAQKYVLQIVSGGGFDPSNALSSVFGNFFGGGGGGGVAGGGVLGDIFGAISGGGLNALTGAGSAIGGVMGAFSAASNGLIGFGTALASAVPVVGQIAAVIATAVKVIKSLDGANTPGTRFNFGTTNRDGTAFASRNSGQIYDTGLGRVGVEGTFVEADRKAFDALFASIASTSQAIIQAFSLSSDQVNKVVAAVEGVKDQPWYKFKDDGSGALADSTVDFMRGYFGAVFGEVNDSIAKAIASFNGTGDQLLAYVNSLVLLTAASEKLGFSATGIVSLATNAEQAASLIQSLAGYQQNFFTESERTAAATDSLAAALKVLGVSSIPETREAFRALVEAADKAGDQKLLAGLIDLQDEFAALVPATSQAVAAVGELNTKIGRAFGPQSVVDLDPAIARIDAFRVSIGLLSQEQANQNGIDRALSSLKTFPAFFEASVDSIINITADQYARATDEQRALLDVILDGYAAQRSAANELKTALDAISGFSAVDAGTALGAGADFRGLIESSFTGTLQERLTKSLGALTDQRSRLAPLAGNDFGYTSTVLAGYDVEISKVSASIARLVTLSAQYGAEFAESILGVQEKYAPLTAQFNDNAYVLGILTKQRDDEIAAILEGGKSVEAATKSFQDFFDTVRGSGELAFEKWKQLAVSDASPASIAERFRLATNQYVADFSALDAGNSDTVDAFSRSGDTRLALAEQYFGKGSTEYRSIFNEFTGQLKEFAVTQPVDFGKAIEKTGANTVEEIKRLRDETVLAREQSAALMRAMIEALERNGAIVQRSVPLQPLSAPVAVV